MYWDICMYIYGFVMSYRCIFTAAAETKIFWQLLRQRIHFNAFCSLPRRRNLSLHQSARKHRAAKVTRNYRPRSKVYQSIVKQLAPTRSMASFVLLQPTVPRRHVSAFRWMFRLGKTKPVTFSILDALPHSIYTSNPSFNGARIIRSMNWPNKFYKRVCAAFFNLPLYSPNYELQISITRVIMLV